MTEENIYDDCHFKNKGINSNLDNFGSMNFIKRKKRVLLVQPNFIFPQSLKPENAFKQWSEELECKQKQLGLDTSGTFPLEPNHSNEEDRDNCTGDLILP